jgi:hypothetical protein
MFRCAWEFQASDLRADGKRYRTYAHAWSTRKSALPKKTQLVGDRVNETRDSLPSANLAIILQAV